MNPPSATLQVSLISSLDHSAASHVAALLSGRAPSATHPASSHDGMADTRESGEFALDLADHLCALADQGTRGHTVVALGPTADPVEIGLIVDRIFDSRGADEHTIRLRDLVTVVSVSDVRHLLFCDHAGADDPIHDYDVAERLALQLEFASVIVMTGGDAHPESWRDEAAALIARLNPRALVVPIGSVARLATTRRHGVDAILLGRSLGWMLELARTADPPTRQHGVNTVVFRDPRPFHPARLAEVVDHCLEPAEVGTILRSRGLIRLASRPQRVGSWASAGRVLNLDPTSMLSWDPESPLGQEIVFFGHELRYDKLLAALSACLLSDDELVAGPMEWANYRDPFPVWPVDDRH